MKACCAAVPGTPAAGVACRLRLAEDPEDEDPEDEDPEDEDPEDEDDDAWADDEDDDETGGVSAWITCRPGMAALPSCALAAAACRLAGALVTSWPAAVPAAWDPLAGLSAATSVPGIAAWPWLA
jgi:hypothetical protein